MIYRQVASFSAYGLGLDLGLNYQLRPGLSIAATLRDITSTPIIWNTDANDRISPSILLGATYQLKVAGGRATVALASRAQAAMQLRAHLCTRVSNIATGL